MGDVGVGEDVDAVHGGHEQAVDAAGGRDGDVGAGAAEDVDGDGCLHGLGAGGDRHQHLRSSATSAVQLEYRVAMRR